MLQTWGRSLAPLCLCICVRDAADAQAHGPELLQLGDADLHLQLQPQLPGTYNDAYQGLGHFHVGGESEIAAVPSAPLDGTLIPFSLSSSLCLVMMPQVIAENESGLLFKNKRDRKIINVDPYVRQDHHTMPPSAWRLIQHLLACLLSESLPVSVSRLSHMGICLWCGCVGRATRATTARVWRSAAPSTCRSPSTTTSHAGRHSHTRPTKGGRGAHENFEPWRV